MMMNRNRILLWLTVALAACHGGEANNARAATELLAFSSPYCGPCQQLKPTLAQMQQQGYPIKQIDVTQHPALASRFNVSRVPCLVMVSNGREVGRQLGGNAGSIQQMFAQAGVRPGQTESVASPAWAQEGAAPPALGAQPVNPSRQNNRTETAHNIASPTDPFAKQLLESSVRITIEDATGRSFGTGTIIDTRQGDALVVTCGHLFRGESAQGQITIEQYEVTPTGLKVVARSLGKLEHFDLDRDVGLVSFRPSVGVKVAKVAEQFGERINDRVWSVGCDLGADPTVRNSRVTDVDRYHGPPNIETSGAPVQGRSGGGLFNRQGELIGVCFAADNEGDEGLYSGLASVHAELDHLGLQAIYRSQLDRAAGQTAQQQLPMSNAAPQRLAENRGGLMALPTGNVSNRIVRGQDTGADASPDAFPAPPVQANNTNAVPLQDLPPQERAGLQEIARRASESEVVVIVRPREVGGASEVLHFNQVSPQFIESLRSMAP